MAKVELKQPIVQEISENIKDAQSVLLWRGGFLVIKIGSAFMKNLKRRCTIRGKGRIKTAYRTGNF